MKRLLFVCAFAALPALVQAQTAPPTPPTVAKKPFVVKGPANRNDPYYWLRDDTRKQPEMLAYLKAENAYADAELAPPRWINALCAAMLSAEGLAIAAGLRLPAGGSRLVVARRLEPA